MNSSELNILIEARDKADHALSLMPPMSQGKLTLAHAIGIMNGLIKIMEEREKRGALI